METNQTIRPDTHTTSIVDPILVNDTLTQALAQLGWQASTENDDDWLNELTHQVHDDIVNREQKVDKMKVQTKPFIAPRPIRPRTLNTKKMQRCLTDKDNYCHAHKRFCK